MALEEETVSLGTLACRTCSHSTTYKLSVVVEAATDVSRVRSWHWGSRGISSDEKGRTEKGEDKERDCGEIDFFPFGQWQIWLF
jgi:hypothetical protein